MPSEDSLLDVANPAGLASALPAVVCVTATRLAPLKTRSAPLAIAVPLATVTCRTITLSTPSAKTLASSAIVQQSAKVLYKGSICEQMGAPTLSIRIPLPSENQQRLTIFPLV